MKKVIKKLAMIIRKTLNKYKLIQAAVLTLYTVVIGAFMTSLPENTIVLLTRNIFDLLPAVLAFYIVSISFTGFWAAIEAKKIIKNL